MSNSKTHLGDTVFIQEEHDCLVLTTEKTDADGLNIIDSAIYLEFETLCALQRYLLKRKLLHKMVQDVRSC